MDQSPQSQLKLLIQKGKEQGYLTFAEVNDHLPQDIIDSDQVEDIISMINDMGIKVAESAPDADELMMQETTTDEDAAEAAAAALATVEKEIGRTTDPVRMYMREMGTVELLTREGEIEIAKRIEEGINQVQISVAEYPEAITYLLEQWDKFEAEEMRLSDIISGFFDPDAEETQISATHIGSELSDDDLADEDDDGDDDEDSADEEADTGPDPEEAREQFEKLRDLYNAARAIFETKGRAHPDAQVAIAEIGDHFRTFKLVPKQFDRMVNNMREMMDKVRV
jgi:RNA polymerase primary sigma factor